MRDSVFVSYSHADVSSLADLRAALAPLGEGLRLRLWDDTNIPPATRWRDEIEEALSTSAAAVLLLSPSFFESSFIREHELPAILQAARSNELRLFAVVLSACEHEGVTGEFQAVHDPVRPLDSLDGEARHRVWQRLADLLREVVARISDDVRIDAEIVRLRHDADEVATVAKVNDKIARASVDPAFDGNETMRENTVVFLEGQRCQALTTFLIEESKRTDLTPERSKAVVRLLQEVALREEKALGRAKELTQLFADQTLAMLEAARKVPPA